MRLFIDTNVLMDLVAYRLPFAYDAIRIFQLKGKGIQLFVSDLTYANAVYVGRKILSSDRLYDTLVELRSYVNISEIGEKAVDEALQLRKEDFEDVLQYFSAKQANADCIITRNKKDFTFSDIPVYTPAEFMENPLFTE